MDLKLHWLDIVTLAVYLVGIAAMGLYFARKNTSTEEYFVGGRSFAGWVIGLSMVGTSISSVTFLAYPGDAYKTAWLRYVPNFMLPVGVLIASYVFLPFFRRGRLTSAYEYLESRFGPSVRVYAGASFLLAQLVRISVILYLVSLLMHEVTGLAPWVCIVIGGVFVALYTIAGGIDAVIWTDVIQTIVLVVGGVICLIVIIAKLPGGLGQIFSVAMDHGKFGFSELGTDGRLRPVGWGFSLQHKTVMMLLFLGLTNWLTEYSGGQNVVQRYVAARSTREARKAMWICVSASLPIWAFYMFLGTALYVFFHVFPTDEAARMLSGAKDTKAEQILPYFIMNHLPRGVTGLVIAAALAAAMSSLDSSINAISTIGIVDIYRRHIRKGRDDGHYLTVARIFATAAAAFMIAGAVILSKMQTKTLQDTGTILVSLVGGGLLGIYLLGFLTNIGDARAIWCGIVCTTAFTAWTILVKNHLLPAWLSAPFDLYYTTFIGNILMFLVGFLAAALLPRTKRDLTNLTVWKQDGR